MKEEDQLQYMSEIDSQDEHITTYRIKEHGPRGHGIQSYIPKTKEPSETIELCAACGHSRVEHSLDMSVKPPRPVCSRDCTCSNFIPQRKDSEPVMLSGQAMHFSQGKLALDQIPVEMLHQLALVYNFGEAKYARNNWHKGTDWHEFYGSCLRHLTKWWLGEDADDESQLPHLAHAIWNLTALLYYQERQLGNDDRDKRH